MKKIQVYFKKGQNMNELIKVELNEKQEPIVSGRMLHEFLEVGTRYDIWFSRMTEYGFMENQDFEAIDQKRTTAQGNQTSFTDHATLEKTN